MYNIQILDNIASVGLDQFSPERYQVGKEVLQADAILVRSQAMHNLTLPTELSIVGRAGVGVNNIPVAKLTTLGIPVVNTPGANANAVKELVITGMLLASRNIPQAWEYSKNLTGDDIYISTQIEQHKKQFAGFELLGKTLGVIGLGNVGVRVANAAIALGMHVIGYDPVIAIKNALELSAEVQQAASLDDLLKRATFISFHVPLTDNTRHMITSNHFHKMQTGVTLLNFARDGIIDHQALLTALTENKVFAYISDFPNQLLQQQRGVISLPHLGASTREAEENCAVMVVKQIKDYLELGHISNAVNFPDIMMTRDAAIRLCIANLNIPNMIAQISQKLGDAKVNIVDMINKSQGEIAYSLFDVASDIKAHTLQAIAAIAGVIKVRKLVF